MDLEVGLGLKNEKVDGMRETVKEKESGAEMVRVWEKRDLDHVRVRYVGELQS